MAKKPKGTVEGREETRWSDLRCRCGSDHVMALSPGYHPGDGVISLFEDPVEPEQAYCLTCWRALFVSDSETARVVES